MYYHSTRNSNLNKTFDEIIIEGLSSDGGLFMPKTAICEGSSPFRPTINIL